MRLIDHGLFPRHHRRTVVAPVEAVVDDNAFRHRARAVAAVECQVGAASTDAIAEQRIRPHQVALQFVRVQDRAATYLD